MKSYDILSLKYLSAMPNLTTANIIDRYSPPVFDHQQHYAKMTYRATNINEQKCRYAQSTLYHSQKRKNASPFNNDYRKKSLNLRTYLRTQKAPDCFKQLLTETKIIHINH